MRPPFPAPGEPKGKCQPRKRKASRAKNQRTDLAQEWAPDFALPVLVRSPFSGFRQLFFQEINHANFNRIHTVKLCQIPGYPVTEMYEIKGALDETFAL